MGIVADVQVQLTFVVKVNTGLDRRSTVGQIEEKAIEIASAAVKRGIPQAVVYSLTTNGFSIANGPEAKADGPPASPSQPPEASQVT